MSEIQPATDEQIELWDGGFIVQGIGARGRTRALIARIRQEQTEVERLREWQKDALDYLGEFCDGTCDTWCTRCDLISKAQAQPPAALPCGHPVSAIYTGGEGTSHCTACERESGAGQAISKAEFRAAFEGDAQPSEVRP